MHSRAVVTMVRASTEIDDGGDTIDGSDREPAAARRAAEPPTTTVDYPELVEVERRHYVVGGEIAKGGVGRVFEARDLRLGRSVAIKELLPKNRHAARRFEREARITARLQHPAIIHIYEAGVWRGGEPFYAMTKVSGRSLAEVVTERTSLAARLGLLPNVIAVADALAYAHSQDVIHRDLKPANILVGAFGETVVIDWGLAKDLSAQGDPAMSLELKLASAEQTLSGSIVGTPAYMAPEQARGEAVDHHADVYALGALLYKVLAGVPPYAGKTSDEVLQRVLAGPPIPVDEREPGAPADLVAIVRKAMARDPQQRYPTAGELAADLKRFETGQLVAAHHYTRRQLGWRWLHRHRVAVAIGAIALAVFAVFGTLSVREIVAERDRAEYEQRKDERRRAALLEERGRAELLAGRAGPALANLAGAVRGAPGGALGFLIAETMRPFEAQIAALSAGAGTVMVAYRPDGTELATASADGRVALWDAAGRPVREIAHAHGRVLALAWSPDGTRLATAGDDKIARVWSPDGVLVHELVGHAGTIGDIAFSSDGTHVVTASADMRARIWKLAAGTSQELVGHDEAVTTARFSPDGKHVVTATRTGAASVWTVRDGQLAWPLRAHTAAIVTARWSPDGTRVLTASADGTARVWDPLRGSAVTAPLHHKGGAAIEDAAWSSDGRRVITAGRDHVARLWLLPDPPAAGELPAAARELAQLAHSDRVVKVMFSLDDRWIVTAGNDRAARVWDARGQPIATFEHADAVASVDFSRDGTTVVTGCRDGTALIWDVTRGIARSQRELASPIHALAVSRTGMIAAGTDDSRVTTWRADGLPTILRGHLGRVFAVAFSPDGTQLATAGEDPEVRLWTPGSEPARRTLAVGGVPVRAVAFGPDGATVVAVDDAGVLRIWSVATGTLVTASPPLGVPLTALAIGPRGDIAAVGSDGVHVWTAAGVPITRHPTTDALRALAFDASGERLAVAGVRDTVILRYANRVLAPELTLEGATGDVTAIAFRRDGTVVFTGGLDGVARVWDAQKGKLLATRDTQGEAIEALALSADDELLWTGASDGIARAWDVRVLRDASVLSGFIAQRVPWRLGEDDVVRRAAR